jgi:hypothetical protein
MGPATDPRHDFDAPGFGRLGRIAMRQVRGLAADYALLAVLDARSAAIRFAWLLSAGLIAAVLIVTAWLALITGALVWLVGSGLGWPAAIGLGAVANVLGAVAIAAWMRGLFSDLPFAATLRQLKGDPPAPSQETQ